MQLNPRKKEYFSNEQLFKVKSLHLNDSNVCVCVFFKGWFIGSFNGLKVVLYPKSEFL